MEDKTIERLYIASLMVILIALTFYFNNEQVSSLVLAVISYFAGIITPTRYISDQIFKNSKK
jgi:hypothetical protein